MIVAHGINKIIPITPQAERAPALPTVLDVSLPPRPRSSVALLSYNTFSTPIPSKGSGTHSMNNKATSER